MYMNLEENWRKMKGKYRNEEKTFKLFQWTQMNSINLEENERKIKNII